MTGLPTHSVAFVSFHLSSIRILLFLTSDLNIVQVSRDFFSLTR